MKKNIIIGILGLIVVGLLAYILIPEYSKTKKLARIEEWVQQSSNTTLDQSQKTALLAEIEAKRNNSFVDFNTSSASESLPGITGGGSASILGPRHSSTGLCTEAWNEIMYALDGAPLEGIDYEALMAVYIRYCLQ